MMRPPSLYHGSSWERYVLNLPVFKAARDELYYVHFRVGFLFKESFAS